jgi:hypothetical protein
MSVKKMVIVDNVLPNVLHEKLLQTVLDVRNFPWYFLPDVVDSRNNKSLLNGGLFHALWENETPYSKISDIGLSVLLLACEKTELNFQSIYRMQTNLLLPTKEKNILSPHVDFDSVQKNDYVLVYYVNESDGDTVIYDCLSPDKFNKSNKIIKQITPKPNSAVIFDARLYHSATCPMQAKSRIVINCCFKVF